MSSGCSLPKWGRSRLCAKSEICTIFQLNHSLFVDLFSHNSFSFDQLVHVWILINMQFKFGNNCFYSSNKWRERPSIDSSIISELLLSTWLLLSFAISLFLSESLSLSCKFVALSMIWFAPSKLAQTWHLKALFWRHKKHLTCLYISNIWHTCHEKLAKCSSLENYLSSRWTKYFQLQTGFGTLPSR